MKYSDVFVSDNGPQYSSIEFRQFTSSYGFRQDTSSPYYLQGNREAKRAVKMVKKLMSGSRDHNLAVVSHQSCFYWANKPALIFQLQQMASNLNFAVKTLPTRVN